MNTVYFLIQLYDQAVFPLSVLIRAPLFDRLLSVMQTWELLNNFLLFVDNTDTSFLSRRDVDIEKPAVAENTNNLTLNFQDGVSYFEMLPNKCMVKGQQVMVMVMAGYGLLSIVNWRGS